MTDTDGQTDTETITFTTPPRLVVACSVADEMLTCDSSNEIMTQICSFDGQSPVECSSPFDISTLGLTVGDHRVTVFITDVYTQTTQYALDFTYAPVPTGPIVLSIPTTVSVTEGLLSVLNFHIEGQAIEDIPFSILPLTYQQFETQTGLQPSDVFTDIPTPASSSKSILYSAIIKQLV